MAKYGLDIHDTADTTNLVGSVRAPNATPMRLKVYDLVMGCEGAPADNAFRWDWLRIDATGGTDTAVTPEPLDPADAAALITGSENFTANPGTLGNILLSIALNQRATIRWVASPGGELVAPATSERGFGPQLPTSTALVVSATIHAEQQ
jgi:hypothetical protein